MFLLDERNELVTEPEKPGEICVSATSVGLGYYRAPEATTAAFVQNPLNDRYPETIYRTGDMASISPSGELIYIGRKDFQIKHMGHRIELGEIERAISALDGIERVLCVYVQESGGPQIGYAAARGQYTGVLQYRCVFGHGRPQPFPQP